MIILALRDKLIHSQSSSARTTQNRSTLTHATALIIYTMQYFMHSYIIDLSAHALRPLGEHYESAALLKCVVSSSSSSFFAVCAISFLHCASETKCRPQVPMFNANSNLTISPNVFINDQTRFMFYIHIYIYIYTHTPYIHLCISPRELATH